MINCEFVFNDYISIFPLWKSKADFFYLVKEYKY